MNLTSNDLQDYGKLQTMRTFLDQFPCLYGIKGVNSRFFVANDTMAKWIGYGTGCQVRDRMDQSG